MMFGKVHRERQRADVASCSCVWLCVCVRSLLQEVQVKAQKAGRLSAGVLGYLVIAAVREAKTIVKAMPVAALKSQV